LIEIIGEAVEGRGTKIRRIAAREIIKRDKLMRNPVCGRDASLAEIAELKYRLTRPANYFAGELRNEPALYSADGILFPVLVHLVRLVENNLFGWGWLPEQVRALGLAINPGDELVGANSLDVYAIKNRHGVYRSYCHFSA
jgi:hypothetical protein